MTDFLHLCPIQLVPVPEASDLPVRPAATSKKSTTASATNTRVSSWWDRAYRAPNVMKVPAQAPEKTGKEAMDEALADGAEGPKDPQDAADAAYEAALRSGKSPEEAARISASAASKAAEKDAESSGKSPEEVEQAAAAAAYKAGMSNGMTDQEAKEASAEVAEEIRSTKAKAKASKSSSESSSSQAGQAGQAGSGDVSNTGGGSDGLGGSEGQKDGSASGAGWLQWLWSLLWPDPTAGTAAAQSTPSKVSQTHTGNETKDVGLQDSDMERLDAILRQERLACIGIIRLLSF